MEHKELKKNTGPAVTDYNPHALKRTDRPLTGQKSHNLASQLFNKAQKDTMKVSLYDKAYERSYKNSVGPGPAAYS